MSKRQTHTHGEEWSPAEKERLRLLWATGMSSAAIGREMGATKNAIVGQARRTNLPARVSPIIARGQPRPQRALRAPKLTSTELDVEKRGPGRTPIVRTLNLLPGLPRPAPIPAPSTGRGCLFPMWGNERAPKPPLFCGEPNEDGRPYCTSHMALCYFRKPAASDLADAA